MAQTLEMRDFHVASSTSTLAPLHCPADQSTQRLPESDSPSSTKKSSVTVKEHPVDQKVTPKLNLSHSNAMTLLKSRQQSIPAPLSTSLSLPNIKSRAGSRKVGTQQSPLLLKLPNDLHYLLVTNYLDFESLLALRQTCRAMHDILTPVLIRRIRAKFVQESLEEESRKYTEYRTNYPRQRFGHLWDLLYAAFDFRLIERPAKELPCYGCLQTKPLWSFVERMSNRGTGLGAKYAPNRMCKDCMRRYRDIEGEWWKENWVKKSDIVRKTTRSRRFRRWMFEGRSLLNPEEEVGVCALCGSGSFELWWGCVSCFELEEQRRRQEDMMDFEGMERKIVDLLETWRVKKKMKNRKRHASRDRRPRKKWWIPRSLSFEFAGNMADRKAALMEWKENKSNQKPSLSSTTTATSTSGVTRDAQWHALSQIPLSKNRREARCSSCWVPNCPRRMYILGLAYERPLPKERWCPDCQDEFDRRHARKKERQQRMKNTRAEGSQVTADKTGIFSDAEGWDGGLGCLFEDSEHGPS